MAQDKELTLFSREFRNMRQSAGLNQQQLHHELLKQGIKIEDNYIENIEQGTALPKDFIEFLSSILMILGNPITNTPANANRLFMGEGDLYMPSITEQKLLRTFRKTPRQDKEKILSFIKKITQD